MRYKTNLRIFIVQITPSTGCRKGVWYYEKAGKIFHCILGIKETEAGVLTPVFYVLDWSNGQYLVPRTIFTIRPEDATVMHDELTEPSRTLMGFINDSTRVRVA